MLVLVMCICMAFGFVACSEATTDIEPTVVESNSGETDDDDDRRPPNVAGETDDDDNRPSSPKKPSKKVGS